MDYPLSSGVENAEEVEEEEEEKEEEEEEEKEEEKKEEKDEENKEENKEEKKEVKEDIRTGFLDAFSTGRPRVAGRSSEKLTITNCRYDGKKHARGCTRSHSLV